jgi:hypothetical protein
LFFHHHHHLFRILPRTSSVRDLLEGFSRASSALLRALHRVHSASTRTHSSQWASR